MRHRRTLTIIRDCHRHQWPEMYSDVKVPYPSTQELLPIYPPRTEERVPGFYPLFTTFCDRCGCDHGLGPAEPPAAP